MTAIVFSAVHICSPRLLAAALFAVAAMLGSGAFGDPSVAFAEPGWGAFDNCARNGLAAGLRSGPVAYDCCNKSGSRLARL